MLYGDFQQGYNPGVMGANGMMTGGYSFALTTYYTSKDENNNFVQLLGRKTKGKKFVQIASEIFSDCPKLTENIKADKYDDMEDIFTFYNTRCSKYYLMSN